MFGVPLNSFTRCLKDVLYICPLNLIEKVSKLSFCGRGITIISLTEITQSIITVDCGPLDETEPTCVAVFIRNTSSSLTDVWFEPVSYTHLTLPTILLV